MPGQELALQGVASVMSVIRSVSVPLGISTPGQPNIASTIWRTVSDSQHLVYYYDSATVPNTFWVELAKLDLDDGNLKYLATVNNFNIRARYDDYKNNFYKICTKEYVMENSSKIIKLYKMLCQKLKQKEL